MKVLNFDGEIVDVTVSSGFDIDALKAGVSNVTGDGAKTFRLRCGKTSLTGKTPDLAAVIEGRTVSMDRISSPFRQAQSRIARGDTHASYAHKTLNRVEETVDKIHADVGRLEGTVVNEAADVKELLTGSSVPEGMTGPVEIRNMWLERVRIAQSHANVAQQQISDNKFQQKMLTMKESALAANQKKVDAMLEKRQEDRNAATAQKAAAKEAKQKTLADKKAAAASKKAAAAAKKAVGGKKRKASADPEAAAIEAETDAALELIEHGVLPMA